VSDLTGGGTPLGEQLIIIIIINLQCTYTAQARQ
jgi:hypothetical protein